MSFKAALIDFWPVGGEVKKAENTPLGILSAFRVVIWNVLAKGFLFTHPAMFYYVHQLITNFISKGYCLLQYSTVGLAAEYESSFKGCKTKN